MHGAFASVFGESWSSLGERRFLFLMLIVFVLLAFVPTRIGDDSFGALAITVAAATLHFAFVLIAAAKHRVVHAALRLGKPRSIWAKRFYEGAPSGQAGASRVPVPVRAFDRSMQGAAAGRDRRGHRGAVPGTPRCRRLATAEAPAPKQ
jgi:hypothetical protein